MKTKTLFLIGALLIIAMSAQAQAMSCLDAITAKNTADFMAGIPALSTQMSSGACENKISFFKNEVVNVQISMKDGSSQGFYLTIQKGFINSITSGTAEKPTMLMNTGECEFDTILNSENKGGAFAYLYLQKKVSLSAKGFFKKLKFGAAKMFMGGAMKKIQTPVDVACA
jgi:hypothetical protein